MDKGIVLLVDDEPVVLQLQAAAVRHFGFDALIAYTTEEALEIACKTPISLVISDVQMPGEGGFDFIEALGKKGLKTMPAIYLTGYDDIEIIRGGLRAGGDDFLLKGMPAAVLRKRIAFWMAGGFRQLPSELRRRALVAANAVTGDTFPGIMQQLNQDTTVVQRISARLGAELEDVPEGFGVRLIERVAFLARLSKITIEESESFSEYIRFPELMLEVMRGLNVPWGKGMAPLFAHFDEWTMDDRFVCAGPKPLKESANHNWYD